MQTFLPYPSFEETASILDYRRLGKQRVEGFQILNIITQPLYTGSYKSNLLRKFPAYYRQFHWNVPDDLPYVWPV